MTERRDFKPKPDLKDLDTWDMIWFMELQKKRRKGEEADREQREGEGKREE